MDKKLYRSRSDRMIAGVCGGLGEYLNVDPVWLRLGFVMLLFATGFGFWAYVILWIIVPEEGRVTTDPSQTVQANVQEMADRAREFGQGIQRGLQSDRAPAAGTDSNSGPILVGAAFILIGGLLLLNQLGLFWWLRWGTLWPVLLIFVGGALLFSRLRG